MNLLSPLELSLFAIESPSRPSHVGGIMLFDPPPDGDTDAFVRQVTDSFLAASPVTPWNRRPVFGLNSLPHWETVDDVELTGHVQRATVPAPGTFGQLMELVAQLYPPLLEHSRPLWVTYIIDGLEHGRMAVFVKAHHALADGVGGLKMLYGSLSSVPDDDPRPIWSPGPSSRRHKSEPGPEKPTNPNPAVQLLLDPAVHLLRAPVALAGFAWDTLKLARQGTALPFTAVKTPSMAARITAERSFAAFDLPLAEVKRLSKVFGGTVNDVVLSVCDDAMRRYADETGGAGNQPMIVLMPVSTRREGDSASNAVGATLVRLGQHDAGPAQRFKQVISASGRVKGAIRGVSTRALQLQTLTMVAAMELREQLPVARELVPNVANFTVSNVPGAPSSTLYLGRAPLVGLYAVPLVNASNAANFTLIPYLDSLCVGIGSARTVIPDTARLAELTLLAFEDLQASAALEGKK
jgi:diacylglycerol O-acyltransferase / wax synthase